MSVRHRWWVFGALAVAAISFVGLYYITGYLWPDPNTIFAKPQLLFLTLMFFGLGASTVPVAAYLNQRFSKPGWLQRDRTRLLRQAAWIGIFGVLLAYLQLTKTLSWMIAAVLAGVFALIETFFLTRE